MAKKANMEKLLAKIAKVTNTDAEELKEKQEQGNLYSYEESLFEAQSVINYYKARIARRPPTRKQGESLLAFTQRQLDYEKATNEWKVRVCEGCHNEFVYAYTYEGVKYCSLDCLDAELKKIGLQVTRGRDLLKRWGYFHPAIVPSSAYAILKKMEETATQQCWEEGQTSSEVLQPSSEPSSENDDADVD